MWKKKDKKLVAINKIMLTVLTQALLGVMTLFTGIILPQHMGPEQYGYLQKFMFYLSYLNILSLGFNDGITLNYAGITKVDLPIKEIRRSIQEVMLYAVAITIIMIIISLRYLGNERYILIMIAFNVVTTFIICIGNGICLAENNSLIYNMTNLFQRLIFSISALACLLLQQQSGKNIIFMDTVSFVVISIFMIFYCRFFFRGEKSSWKRGIIEIKKLCISGFTIALSVTIMGLMPSFGRVIVEKYESIYTYGIYSFYVAVLNIILSFTCAVGVIAFPIMKNIDKCKLPAYYKKLTFFYQGIGAWMFYAYIPLYLIIKYYMPEYGTYISCLAVLLALCYPLGKIQILLTPFYKSYRMERKMLFINLFCMAIMILTIWVFYKIWNNIFVIAIVTSIIIFIYQKILESFLSYQIKELQQKWKVLDWFTPVCFVVCSISGTLLNFILFYTIYAIGITIFWVLKRKEVFYEDNLFGNSVPKE